MRKKGMLLTCDACGASTFLEALSDGETDGGYTRFNRFEKAESGWCMKDGGNRRLDLCPSCSARYEDGVRALLGELGVGVGE